MTEHREDRLARLAPQFKPMCDIIRAARQVLDGPEMDIRLQALEDAFRAFDEAEHDA